MGKKKKPFDFPLFLVIIILLCIGITMVFSASMYEDFFYYHDKFYHFKKQLIWSAIGIFVLIFTANIDYKKLKNRKLVNFGMLITLICLIVVFMLPAVKEVHRWIGIGSFLRFQPSELAKLMIIIYIAEYISRKGSSISEWKKIFSVLLTSGIFAGLILKEPNMSNAVIIMATAFCMLFVGGAKIQHLLVLLVLGFGGGTYFAFSEDYRKKRVFGFLDPFKDPLDKGYQAIQSLYALGVGNIFGVGLGKSRQKGYYIPEAQNDFIFAIIGEELGFLGTFFIIVLFAVLIWRGMKIALNCKDRFGALLAAGITSLIAVQSSINFLVVASFMPVTGVTLPLISYGGSSLVFTMVELGLLLSISRYSE